MLLNHYRVGSGEPLVLLHGIGSRWQMWEPVIDLLAREREVVALDLPGFASSPMPPAETPPGLASLTRLVGEFLDDLGLDRPHVAGNSLGGWISLELAKQNRARSATALSPAGFAQGFELRYAHGLLLLSVRIARLAAPRAERLMSSGLARALAFSLFVAKPARLTVADAAPALRDLAWAPWFDATLPTLFSQGFTGGEQVRVPVTIAWCAKDRLLWPRQATRAAGRIPGARLVMLRGCGHVPTYDDPEQVTRVLLEGSSKD